MDWREALEIVMTRTGHEPYRELCGDDHPDRELWRARMIAKVEGRPLPEVGSRTPPEPSPYQGEGGEGLQYPPVYVQAANLAGAMIRAATAAIQGEPVKVPHDVYMHRLDVCLRCEFNGAGPYAVHCTKCGCSGMKLMFATEACPDDPPRWARWEPPA